MKNTIKILAIALLVAAISLQCFYADITNHLNK